MRAALIQLTVGDDPAANLAVTLPLVEAAVQAGADLILTPECTNVLSPNRAHLAATLQDEASDATLAALRGATGGRAHILIGSLGLKVDGQDGRFANRSVLIAPDGAIAARYDKIHMFDVNVSANEVYRESASYRPGGQAVVADLPGARLGLSVCYDLRFPHLFRRLAKGGASILAVPAAFNHITGAAHWEVLLRARAIETGCFVLAPAQTGLHPEGASPGTRRTHGHSLAVSPWGEVLVDAGTDPGLTIIDLDLDEVASARHRIPSLQHDRDFDGP